MSVLGRPRVAATLARTMQRLAAAAAARQRPQRFPEYVGDTRAITIPTSVAPAPAVIYRPVFRSPQNTHRPPVHVNFHGGGYILPMVSLDDPLCRFLAAVADVVVVNVDYVVAPQHTFPAAPYQAYEVVKWLASHGDEHDWDGQRLSVGGQSAGAGLAAAVARQALERRDPAIALQVLHYPPLDLTMRLKHKRSVIRRPRLKPWMAEIFDGAYVPDRSRLSDRLASPAASLDTADLTGIAPAVIITPEWDVLRDEGVRYARRLERVGALVEHVDVPEADHGYDLDDLAKAREVYALIARHLRNRFVIDRD